MTDLFGHNPSHNPGGKLKSKLPAGLQGDAVFRGGASEYRPVLRRWVGNIFPSSYVLFIGMNPSTADAGANDPTITREWSFAHRMGYSGLVKCNIADYRATDPSTFFQQAVVPRHEDNLSHIAAWAEDADKIIICHGKLIKPLAPFGVETLDMLTAAGHKLWCFGRNADASPKHPLYLRGDTELIRFV